MSLQTRIWLSTPQDVDNILPLAQQLYPGRGVEQAVPWVKWAIAAPDHLVLSGDRSLGVASVTRHYGFEYRGRCDILFGQEHWTTFRMLRYMLAWAASLGAAGAFKLDADTGVDFEPFAKRLHGTKVTKTYYELPYAGGGYE